MSTAAGLEVAGAAPPAGNAAHKNSHLDLAYSAGASAKRAQLRRLLAQIDVDEATRRRSVQQAILQAESWWWRMRAEQFHQARPREGDVHGNASPAELAEATARCDAIAQACLNKADLLDMEAEAA
jgi:hypothetical protein